MAVRIKEGMIPYKGGDGIEITNNHIINVLLREANNLIHINENRELYVDLQLDDGIAPDDDFPVGVTTGKILQEDGWQQNGLILNWKTTSGDYARLIYANDGNLYVDLGDGQWLLLMNGGGNNAVWGQITGTLSDQLDLQDALDHKVNLGDNDIFDNTVVKLNKATDSGGVVVIGNWVELDPNGEVMTHHVNTAGFKDAILGNGNITLLTNTALGGDKSVIIDSEAIYVDDGTTAKTYYFLGQHRIATLDDINFAGAMTYKGNVNSSADLPSSGQQVGDCWYDETDHTLWAWDGTTWRDVGGTGIDLTNYFNMQVNTSDDITEGNIHLFCTSIEKNYWNSKQDALTAGNGIDITSNVISAKYTAGSNISIDSNFAINNDAPFEPDNQGSLGQLLQKTSNGYEWRTLNYVSSVNGQSGPVTVDEFNPENAGTTGQVLKKTNTGYQWENETAGSYTGGAGINVNQSTKQISNTLPFNPSNSGTSGQVLKLNQDGTTYSWQNESGGGGGGGTTYYGGDYITIDSSNYINNTAPFIPAGGTGTTGQVLTKTSGGYTWDDIELPSGENNVKFWTVNSQGMTSSSLEPIFQWVNADVHNGAILNDSVTQDAFIFNQIKTINGNPTAVFLGKKRNSQAHLGTKGYYTTQWEWEIRITSSNGGYAISILESEDDNTKTNYISALPVGYTAADAFMPTEDYEPATKKYVDTVAGGGGGGSYTAGAGINITNHVISNTGVLKDTTGTTSSCGAIWVGSASEYANIQNPSATTLYIVFPTS